MCADGFAVRDAGVAVDASAGAPAVGVSPLDW